MKTKHPIYKAYKDGELIENQYNAIGTGKYEYEDSGIDPDECDDLRLFTGAETSDGEPIYEGDILYDETGRNYDVYFNKEYLQFLVVCYGTLSELLSDGKTITHKKPQPERRKGERRDSIGHNHGRRTASNRRQS